MFDPKLERLAKEVRKNAGATGLPVSLQGIAEYDDIILEPVTEHTGFNGKIEFLPEENTFVIFHPDPVTYRYRTRLRFSIAHELAHFHIDAHREALVRGETHNSLPGFQSKDPKEIQADEFAAALLIPADTMEPTINKRGFLTLQEIRVIATNCDASLYATAIRYVRMTGEVCFVVLAQNGAIRSSFFSDEARYCRYGKLQISALPSHSPGNALADHALSSEVREQKHDVSAWSPHHNGITLWENCTPLGEGFTLSLVSVETEAGN